MLFLSVIWTWWCNRKKARSLCPSECIEHLDFNFVFCFKVKILDCQAVVGSFRFLKEELYIGPQILKDALHRKPSPVSTSAFFVSPFSEGDPVMQEGRCRIPLWGLPVHAYPAVLVVAHRCQHLIPDSDSWPVWGSFGFVDIVYLLHFFDLVAIIT